MKKLFACADQFIKESNWKDYVSPKEKKKYSFFMAFTPEKNQGKDS